jgi:two-component system cell cycle response regulator DivK
VGQKILVVEDNELNLKLFCDLLRAHGYEAEPVRDGRDALARARDFTPDLVVMDIQMPYVSGLELIEQMKADEGLRRTPIMAVTAYAAKGDEERIRDAGAEGYVSKPISVMRFVEAVAGLLTAAAARPADDQPTAPASEAGAEAPPSAPEPEALATSPIPEPEPEVRMEEAPPPDEVPAAPAADRLPFDPPLPLPEAVEAVSPGKNDAAAPAPAQAEGAKKARRPAKRRPKQERPSPDPGTA